MILETIFTVLLVLTFPKCNLPFLNFQYYRRYEEFCLDFDKFVWCSSLFLSNNLFKPEQKQQMFLDNKQLEIRPKTTALQLCNSSETVVF